MLGSCSHKNQFLQTPVRDTLQDPMLYRIVANFFELTDIYESYYQG